MAQYDRIALGSQHLRFGVERRLGDDEIERLEKVELAGIGDLGEAVGDPAAVVVAGEADYCMRRGVAVDAPDPRTVLGGVQPVVEVDGRSLPIRSTSKIPAHEYG